MKRTPLKIKKLNSLKRTPLNKVSKKQKIKNDLWVKIKQERIELLIKKYGFLICEYCGTPIQESEIIDGHHNDRNRNNNTLQNCRIVQRFPCHRYITDENVKDVPDLLKGEN